jgi:hypothetical protein
LILIYDEKGKIQWTIKTITCYRSNPPSTTKVNGEISLCGPEFPYWYAILYVPAGRVDIYENNEAWGDFDVRPISEASIEDIHFDTHQATKKLHNGQILILRDDCTYTLQGQEVK